MGEIDIDRLHVLIEVLQPQRNQANDTLTRVQADLVLATRELERFRRAANAAQPDP